MLFELFEVALASILKTGSSRSHHDDCENRVGAYRDGKKIVLIKDDHWVHYTKHSFSIKVVEEKRKPLPWPGITGLLGNNDEYLKRFCSKHAISYRVIDLGAQEVARKLHRENSLGMGGSLPTYYELITDDRKVQDIYERTQSVLVPDLMEIGRPFAEKVEGHPFLLTFAEKETPFLHSDEYLCVILVSAKGVEISGGKHFRGSYELFETHGLRKLMSDEEKLGVGVTVLKGVQCPNESYETPIITVESNVASHCKEIACDGDYAIRIALRRKLTPVTPPKMSDW